MKKFMLCVMTAVLLLTLNPTPSAAAELTPASTPLSNSADAEKINVMVTRLKEIEAMDKSNLSASEKRVLRKEVREIKKVVKRASGGVYISVGVLLLIIILLLIL